MKKLLFILLILFGFQKAYTQDGSHTMKQHIDSLDLWEYSFSKSVDNTKKIGTLVLRRKNDIQNEQKSKSITPQIVFDIYPISFADSINNLEHDRIMFLSCCYPICGATIETTINFLFWSNPWSITSALHCKGVDYTRKNAELILKKVKNKSYNSIEELIKELPINQIKTKNLIQH